MTCSISSHPTNSFRALLLGMLSLLTLSAQQASGQLIFCNRTASSLTNAVGVLQDTTSSTVGWINLSPGECRVIVNSTLQRFYLYAASPSDRVELESNGLEPKILCTSPEVFTITGHSGAESCSARGLDSHTFQLIQGIGIGTAHTLSLSLGGRGGLLATITSNSGGSESKPQSTVSGQPTALRLPLDRGIKTVLGRIEQLVPEEIDNLAEWVPVTDRLVVRYKIWRDPIRVSFRGDQVASGSLRLYYRAQAGMRLADRREGRPAVMTIGSCGMDTPRIIDVSFVMNLVGDHYVPKTRLDPLEFINPCRPTAFKVDISGRIRKELQAEFEEFARTMDERLSHQSLN
jgi:uncharacterized membrane protein